MPSLQYKVVENILMKPLAGDRLPGDKIDIWEKWVKQGRKGAKELVEKYGTKEYATNTKLPEQPRLTTEVSEKEYKRLFKSTLTNPMLRKVIEEELNKPKKK